MPQPISPAIWPQARAFFLFLAVAFAPLALAATDVEIEFAVPGEGRITLGVFDSSGRLVRMLHRIDKQDRLKAGLNGLIALWDGLTDAGTRARPGQYYLRGYLIGDEVRVKGENYLFNDWAAETGFPGFSKVRDFSLLEGGDVALLADTGSGGTVLSRFSPEKGFQWSVRAGHPEDSALPSGASLSSNSESLVVASALGIGIYSQGDGRECMWSARISEDPVPGAMAANDAKVFFSTASGLAEVALPALSDVSRLPQPAPFAAMDADESLLLGAAADGVWLRKESFGRIPLPATATSVALGMPGTFWFVGAESGRAFVGQASFAGEILRMLTPGPGEPSPERIRASRTSDQFAVLESLSALQRLRVMARSESGEWVIEWEKSTRDCAGFGFVNGEPAADSGVVPQEKELRFRLKENPLTGKREFLTVKTECGREGTSLVSPDGLTLVQISQSPGFKRAVLHRSADPSSLRLLQGNGEYVEEFAVTGLDDITPLDAGSFELR